MANPMLAALMQNKLGPVKQAMNMMQTAANPNAMVNQLLQQNPQVQQLIQQAGGDPKKAFYTLAQQMGVDPDAFISQIKSGI